MAKMLLKNHPFDCFVTFPTTRQIYSSVLKMATLPKATMTRGIRMYHSVEVAWKMLQIAQSNGIRLSNLQLQKLVYIAHGYFLGWKTQPLISEPVEAWNYGPVVSPIYHEFKYYGDGKIPVSSAVKTELDSDADAVSVINGVLNLYGNMEAIQLVNLTHQPDTPWDIAWNKQGGRQYVSYPIDNEIIKNHFRKVISDPKSVGGL